MVLRVYEDHFIRMQAALTKFLPEFIEHDIGLPENFKFRYPSSIIKSWDLISIDFGNIEYKMLNINLKGTSFLTVPDDNGKEALFVNSEALRKWDINFDIVFNFWPIPLKSHVELVLDGLDIDFTTKLDLSKEGYILPQIQQLDIKLGNSNLMFSSQLFKFLFTNFVEFNVEMIENTSRILGQYIFTELIGPVLYKALNNYTQEIHL